MKESAQDLGRGCRGLDPLTVVLSAGQTGHSVRSARERGTKLPEQTAIPTPLLRNDVCPELHHHNLTSVSLIISPSQLMT